MYLVGFLQPRITMHGTTNIKCQPVQGAPCASCNRLPPSSIPNVCLRYGARAKIRYGHNVVVLRTRQWTHYLLTGSDSLHEATAQYQHVAITLRSRQLLKMGTWLPETCWATCKEEINDNTKVTSSWFLIPYWITMHGQPHMRSQNTFVFTATTITNSNLPSILLPPPSWHTDVH